MGSLCPDCTTATPTPQHHHAAHTERMAWTWTGYDLDAVHRFKEDNFFQTGRNLAEDRFWKTQIHGSDRRGTQSSISLGETGSVNSNDYHQRFHYSYSEPRERSNSVIRRKSVNLKRKRKPRWMRILTRIVKNQRMPMLKKKRKRRRKKRRKR